MKIGVLTSSRADYGIYIHLLQKLKIDNRFQLEIIAFGMHLQKSQGNTIEEIKKDGYFVIHQVGKMPDEDGILDISRGYGEMTVAFAEFWNENSFDLVFALGDRWEMSAAVQASIPFEVKFAHIHGGETTLGAADNIYRHQISLVSKYHFTSAEEFSERVKSIIGAEKRVYVVGSISLEGIDSLELPEWASVREKFDIPFDDFILVTFHSESLGVDKNKGYSEITYNALETLVGNYNILITMSNSDVLGSLYNNQFKRLVKRYPNKVKLVSSLGKLNYFRAMKNCLFMLGNTSSGIIESASFKKWVVNVGDRQKGRLRNNNVRDTSFNAKQILSAVEYIIKTPLKCGKNKYVRRGTTDRIIEIIRE